MSKLHVHPMDLRAYLSRMGFTQIGFAKLLGINDRTVRRWLSGETAIPKWVDLIINSK